MTRKKLPPPVYLFIAAALGLTQFFYYETSGFLSKHIAIVTYIPKLPALDDRIPLVPAFVIIYVLAFVQWVLCPYLTAGVERERYADYVVGSFVALSVGFVWMCLFPGVMDRGAEHILEKLGSDPCSRLLAWFITTCDPGELGPNLMPSYHTLSSTYCYLGVMGSRALPKSLRGGTLLFSTLVILSTLFVKQHYVLDAVAGVLLAVVCYALTRRYHWGRILYPLLEKYDPK